MSTVCYLPQTRCTDCWTQAHS